MYKVHHPKAETDRLYVKRKEGGRGLVQNEAAYKAEIIVLHNTLTHKLDKFVNIVKSYESTQPTMNTIIKTAVKIAEELINQMRKVTQNRKEYNIQRQYWERI